MEISMSAIVTAGCFLLLHTGGLIWVLSALTTTVRFLSTELQSLKTSIDSLDARLRKQETGQDE